MINDKSKFFEINLVERSKNDSNSELAEALIKEYSAHMYQKTDCTKELQAWADKGITEYLKDKKKATLAFGLEEKWARSKTEIKYINMNVHAWQFILKGLPKHKVYEEIANMFATTADDVRIGFERKNHDFGTRELCRLSLDIFVMINKKQLTIKEAHLINENLKEEIAVQMEKDLNHHRIKYE